MFSLPRIFLGSSSPRRIELLKQVGFEVTLVPHNIKEDFPKNIPKRKVGEFLAKKKLYAVIHSYGKDINRCYLTSDSIVLVNNDIVGKPKDKIEAIEILKTLSGKKHEVITGVCVNWLGKEITFSESTKVFLTPLSMKMIEYYITHFNPYDKAGSYGIQEWLGMVGVKKIEGDFFNVTGLPIRKVYETIVELMSLQEPS